MDRKFNVGNLSARRATSSMARALGTKHELGSTGSAQSTNRSFHQFTASGGTLATRLGILRNLRDYLISAVIRASAVT
jgi:hypothetical protein